MSVVRGIEICVLALLMLFGSLTLMSSVLDYSGSFSNLGTLTGFSGDRLFRCWCRRNAGSLSMRLIANGYPLRFMSPRLWG